MFPKLNSREMAKALQRMGVQQTEIEAEQVVIKCKDKDIIILNPQVTKVKMAGQENYQISGTTQEREKTTETDIKPEDIQTVMQQTNATEEQAREEIKKTGGDLAQAILNLQ